MSEKLLEIKDLFVEYTSGGKVIKAVNGVDLSLEKGKTLGLVGETGAGKTTIAKSILRILPDPPAKIRNGEIWFEGQDMMKLHAKEMLKIRGDKIAMIFQDPMTALNPTMTVGNQIAEVIKLHNDISSKEATERAVSMLEMVGIPAMRYMEYPHQFSGGMKQRVVIAMALACTPALLLADEPTTALDVTIQAQVLEMMMELRDRLGTSMILITHDLGIIYETADDVAIIYAGKIVESGTKEDIFRNPQHPYTIGLFGALPKLNDNSKRLHPILGLPPDPTNLPEGCSFHPRCPRACEACKSGSFDEMTEITPGHFVRCIRCGKED